MAHRHNKAIRANNVMWIQFMVMPRIMGTVVDSRHFFNLVDQLCYSSTCIRAGEYGLLIAAQINTVMAPICQPNVSGAIM